MTKRLAELGLQALSVSGRLGDCTLAVVRFGNVLGSSGSVIPLFEAQIARGGAVTVTHPEATRFFMTISEAVGLVLEAATQNQLDRLFLLDMGDPVRIDDMARDLIRLKGYEPERDIPIQYMGLRSGEKLHEKLRFPHETPVATSHPKVVAVCGAEMSVDAAERLLRKLDELTLLARQRKDKLRFKERMQAILEGAMTTKRG